MHYLFKNFSLTHLIISIAINLFHKTHRRKIDTPHLDRLLPPNLYNKFSLTNIIIDPKGGFCGKF